MQIVRSFNVILQDLTYTFIKNASKQEERQWQKINKTARSMLTHKTGAVCISLYLPTPCHCRLLHTLKDVLALENKENHCASDYIQLRVLSRKAFVASVAFWRRRWTRLYTRQVRQPGVTSRNNPLPFNFHSSYHPSRRVADLGDNGDLWANDTGQNVRIS